MREGLDVLLFSAAVKLIAGLMFPCTLSFQVRKRARRSDPDVQLPSKRSKVKESRNNQKEGKPAVASSVERTREPVPRPVPDIPTVKTSDDRLPSLSSLMQPANTSNEQIPSSSTLVRTMSSSEELPRLEERKLSQKSQTSVRDKMNLREMHTGTYSETGVEMHITPDKRVMSPADSHPRNQYILRKQKKYTLRRTFAGFENLRLSSV